MARYQSVVNPSTIHFFGLVVFACLVMGSIVWFFGSADMVHRVKMTGTTEDFRKTAAYREYGTLTDQQRRIFDETIDSGRYVSDERFDFPEAVKRNGTYYQFRYTKAFDWGDPDTYQPALVWLSGMMGIIGVLRRDIR